MEPLEQTNRLRAAEAEVFQLSWLVGSTSQKPRSFNPQKARSTRKQLNVVGKSRRGWSFLLRWHFIPARGQSGECRVSLCAVDRQAEDVLVLTARNIAEATPANGEGAVDAKDRTTAPDSLEPVRMQWQCVFVVRNENATDTLA